MCRSRAEELVKHPGEKQLLLRKISSQSLSLMKVYNSSLQMGPVGHKKKMGTGKEKGNQEK